MPDVFAALLAIIDKVASFYAGTFIRLSRQLFDVVGLKIELNIEQPGSREYDDRIAKLDVARDALTDSLAAIEEMKRDAQAAKDEYAATSSDLQAILASSQDAESKLTRIREAIRQDVAAFQTLAGVPNLRRERWIAFLAGIIASTVSAGLVALAVWGWGRLS